MKKRIAIIGANEFQNPLILKAKELGYETFVFAWKAGDIGETTADHFIPISIIEKEKIWDYCKMRKINACVSIGSDLATHTVNYIQRKLGKPCNPIETDIIATNKFEMRKAFLASNISCPKFTKINQSFNVNDFKDFNYPLIVKPVDRSGSRGIYKVDSQEQLKKAVANSIKESFSGEVIVEEFINGDEYSCESISFNGKHTILQFTKKYTTGAPHFIEIGHKEPSDIPQVFLENISMQIISALDALHIKYGASHTEFKVDENWNIHIIEIGARMGGDCIGSDLVPLSTGYDFVRMVIDVALGNDISFDKISEPKEAHISFVFSNNELLLYEQIKNNPYYKIVRYSFDESMEGEVTDSSTRHGFFIYTN